MNKFQASVHDIAGCRVHVTDGAGGQLVLLVRLAARGAGVWDGLVPLLAQHHRVASIDFSLPREGWSDAGRLLRDFGRTAVEVAAKLQEGPFHLVGWNGGAQMALQAAVHHGARLASLVLVTPFRDVGERRQFEVGLDILEMFLRAGRRDLYTYNWFMAGLSDGFLQRRFEEVERLVAERLAGDPFVALDVDRAMRWMRDLREDWVADDELRAIAAPTLILAGGLNRWHAGPTPEMAEALHRLIPGSELETYADRGPLFLLEDPAPAATRMLEFFARHDRPRRSG